jgi:phospholipid/cholesterol/gamma-HCH transport system ATP-binding protein
MFTDISESDKTNHALDCLKKVELEGAENLYPASLSGGMMKRVGIARAISMKPRFLFCDEPNSGLDPKTGIVIDDLIQKLTYELNMTTVVISHDMNSIVQTGDRINFLHEGSLKWKGDKKEILIADNKALNDFAFASDLMKRLK